MSDQDEPVTILQDFFALRRKILRDADMSSDAKVAALLAMEFLAVILVGGFEEISVTLPAGAMQLAMDLGATSDDAQTVGLPDGCGTKIEGRA